MNKKEKKHADKKCHFCPEDCYESLHVHRIKPGSENGHYVEGNCVTCCSNCHAKIHANKIIIDTWYSSTAGRLLHYSQNGEEHWD